MYGNNFRRTLLSGLCLVAFGTAQRIRAMAAPPHPPPPARSDPRDALTAWKTGSSENTPSRDPDHDAWRLTGLPDANGRCTWDIDLTHEAAPVGILDIRYLPETSDNVRAITLHLRSGPGWHSFEISSPGAQSGHKMIDPSASVLTENKPGDWRKSDKLRISLWAQDPRRPLTLALKAIDWRHALAAVARPTLSSSNPAESVYGKRMAKDFFERLVALGIPTRLIDDDDILRGEAETVSLLALPCNPQPPPEMVRALASYIEKGGRLMVCYNSADALGSLMNIEVGRFTSTGQPGRWHSYAVPGHDRNIRQSRTPHLLTARPSAGSTEVIARWRNADAELQPEIAWMHSPGRGWWHTAVFSREDHQAKQHFLAEAIALEFPEVWKLYAEHLAESLLPRLAKTPASRKQAAAVKSLLAGNQYEQAVRAFHTIRRELSASAKSMLSSQKMPPFIGVWDHFGLGLHGGNWERTARMLARYGVGEVFLYRPLPASAENPPGGNPMLRAAIRAGERHGLRVHAWHICWSTSGRPARQVQQWREEGRLQRDIEGNSRSWLCPSHPGNRAGEISAIQRLATAPGLAGLHLDYIRYPDSQTCYCEICRETFQSDTGIRVENWPEALLQKPMRDRFLHWRSGQIHGFVRQVSQNLRSRFPKLLVSAAVLPDLDSARTSFGQDWAAWLDEGLLDFVCPMTYTENPSKLEAWWRAYKARFGDMSRIRPGLGVTANDSSLDARATAEQLRFLSERGATGMVFFDLNFTLANEVLPFLGLQSLSPREASP